MEDLTKRGLSATRLQKGLSSELEDDLYKGKVMYIFGSPEAFDERKWKSMLLTPTYQIYLSAVVVDEAHCVDLWGSSKEPFRAAYRRLGDLHSFIPTDIPFVALTATATTMTRRTITASLRMKNPTTVSLSPNHNNIRYSVQCVSEDFSVVFHWLFEELLMKGQKTNKTIVFCRTIETCARLYSLFTITLKEKGYVEQSVSLDACLFALYHAKITEEEKSVILQSFGKVDGKCRVLFTTIAFGMGMNICNIRRVIHLGPSRDIEEYVQETGRGGRDGSLCQAILYVFSGCTRGHISLGMKDYIHRNQLCRRLCLFQAFPGSFSRPGVLHDCCDFCQSECLCACICRCCICGKGTPCQFCCTCSKKCNFVPKPCLLNKSYISRDDATLPSLIQAIKLDEGASYFTFT